MTTDGKGPMESTESTGFALAVSKVHVKHSSEFQMWWSCDEWLDGVRCVVLVSDELMVEASEGIPAYRRGLS